MKSHRAIIALRLISGLVVMLGLIGTIDGIINYKTIPLFAFNVPTFVVAFSVFYMGLRYWRRIPEFEKKVEGSARFSWENFPLVKGN